MNVSSLENVSVNFIGKQSRIQCTLAYCHVVEGHAYFFEMYNSIIYMICSGITGCNITINS